MRVVFFSVCELGEGPVTIHKVAFLFEHARPRSLYCPVHDRRVVIPVAFTIADDASLGTAVGRKHAKYDPWLLRNSSASVARLVPGACDPHSWTVGPLVVVVVGVWGTVSHSAIAALTALGLSVAAINTALSAVLDT